MLFRVILLSLWKFIYQRFPNAVFNAFLNPDYYF